MSRAIRVQDENGNDDYIVVEQPVVDHGTDMSGNRIRHQGLAEFYLSGGESVNHVQGGEFKAVVSEKTYSAVEQADIEWLQKEFPR